MPPPEDSIGVILKPMPVGQYIMPGDIKLWDELDCQHQWMKVTYYVKEGTDTEFFKVVCPACGTRKEIEI